MQVIVKCCRAVNTPEFEPALQACPPEQELSQIAMFYQGYTGCHLQAAIAIDILGFIYQLFVVSSEKPQAKNVSKLNFLRQVSPDKCLVSVSCNELQLRDLHYREHNF